MKKESLTKSINLFKTMSWAEYVGKWVAVANGEFLGAKDTYKEALAEYKDVEDIIITRILPPSDDVM